MVSTAIRSCGLPYSILFYFILLYFTLFYNKLRKCEELAVTVESRSYCVEMLT
jgi:energy-coupling factor transporter transmembrane protein EcfT